MDLTQPARWLDVLRVSLVTAAILVLAHVAGAAAVAVYGKYAVPGGAHVEAPGYAESLMAGQLAAYLLLFQGVAAVLTLAAAHGIWQDATLTSFGWPAHGFRSLLRTAAALLVLAGLYGATVYLFDPTALERDVLPFAGIARSRWWWIILAAAGIGAPVAEELVFRGLLFGRLRHSPLGISGAAVTSAACWSVLHVQYSLYGLAAIFAMGIFLALAREKTGSLLAPAFGHGVYNSLIVLTMAFAPDSALTGVSR